MNKICNSAKMRTILSNYTIYKKPKKVICSYQYIYIIIYIEPKEHMSSYKKFMSKMINYESHILTDL